MSIKSEYSRLIVKRSTQTGVIPTIPSSSTLDDTWLSTDIYIGELFINTADDKIWYRADSGIVEITGGGGGGGDSIMSANDTMTANRTQDLAGFIQTWDDGTFLSTDIIHSMLNGETTANEHPFVSVNYSLGNTSTALTVDLSKGNYFRATATDNFSIGFSNAPGSEDMRGYVLITQDGTGSRVLSLGTNVISAKGVVPLLTTTASAVDLVEFTYLDGLGKFLITGIVNDVK